MRQCCKFPANTALEGLLIPQVPRHCLRFKRATRTRRVLTSRFRAERAARNSMTIRTYSRSIHTSRSMLLHRAHSARR